MDATDLALHFGLRGPARLSDGPVARGKQGVVWRLETADGRWAVKEPFRPTGEDDVRGSTEFQEAAHAGGVPTPRVRRTTDGHVFATTTDGRRVRLYEWVDLLPPDPSLDPALVGAAVAAMHRLGTPMSGPPEPWHHEPVGARAWDRLIGRLEDAGAPFTRRLADLRDELVALESWIEPPRVLQMCHRDLWADNVLPTPDGGLCVVDWEESGPADPSYELGYVLFEFARSDPGRARTLTDAYREAGGPATVSRRADFSMLIALLGHVTELAAEDWLVPNQRSPERADSVAWISEVFDEPHTRELLDELLDAVHGGTGPGPAP